MPESWITISCPQCVRLGHESARHLFTVHVVGDLIETPNQYLMFSCKRCRTKYKWTYGMKLPEVLVLGKSHKPRMAVFE